MSNESSKTKTSPKPVAVGGVNQSYSVPRESIIIPKGFNVRRTMAEADVKGLAQDIKQRGLLNPPNVVHGSKPGTFEVVAGFTRMAALDILGWNVIPVTVLSDTTKEGAYFANLAENVVRESIPTYDLAIRLAEIKGRFKLTANDIAARLSAGEDEGGKRLSKSSINNYINLVNNLHDALLVMWEGGKVGPLALLKVVAEPKDDQPSKLAEVLRVKESDITGTPEVKPEAGAPGAGAEDAPPRIVKPSEEYVRIALKTVENSTVKMTENEKDALLAALGFVLGMVPNLNLGSRILFSPEQHKANVKTLRKEALDKAKAGAVPNAVP